MPQNPRVSVFIPVHNREHYVAVAVNSILAQTFTDFELIVVDDGSTDRTPEVLSRYSDPRLRIARNPSNLGIPATRNHGLELARGEYIALLDSDDHAYPERLARQVAWLDSHPDIAQVGSWCSFMDSEEIRAHLLFHCPVVNRTVMARTAALKAIGYDTAFPRCQDYEMHCRLVEAGHRLANLPELLVCGREHPGRITGQTRGLGRDRKIAIQRRMLDHLGIQASAEELARHYALSRKSAREDDPESYLDWAESWLWRIKQANRAARFFNEPALSRVLGAIWALNCWQARRTLGKRATLARLARSGLARGIPGNVDFGFLLAARRRAPVAAADDTTPGP
jgi:glycosyltransferase involved in cell wall biosynthesis